MLICIMGQLADAILDVNTTLADSMDRMEGIIRQAERIVRDGTRDDLARLMPLRLQMAGAMTSRQMLLHREEPDDGQSALPEPKCEQRRSWDALATEFRTFASLQQSSVPPAWQVYAPAALALFKRIRRRILQTRRAFSS